MTRRRPSILPINRAPDSTRPFTIDDEEWLRRATAGAIKHMKKVLAQLPAGTSVSSLSEHEYGWLAAAAIFGWVAIRAEQSVAEGLSLEEALWVTKLSPDPRDVGAAGAILPRLADIGGIDWTKPLSTWSREEIITLVLAAHDLVGEAMVVRDRNEDQTVPAVNYFDPNAAEGADPHNPREHFPDNLAESIGLPP